MSWRYARPLAMPRAMRSRTLHPRFIGGVPGSSSGQGATPELDVSWTLAVEKRTRRRSARSIGEEVPVGGAGEHWPEGAGAGFFRAEEEVFGMDGPLR